MSSGPKTKSLSAEVSAEQVARFLTDNPAFFDQHVELLSKLRIRHPSGQAVSLIERQVELLRQQNRQLDRKMVDLIEVARSNDATVEKIHQLSLAVIQADELHDFLTTLQDMMRNRFAADEVAICLFKGDAKEFESTPARRVEREQVAQHFKSIMQDGKPLCGRLREAQSEFLFGERAGALGSVAIIPIGEKAECGLLAVGSESEDQFGPTLGTLYLKRMSELISSRLEPMLAD